MGAILSGPMGVCEYDEYGRAPNSGQFFYSLTLTRAGCGLQHFQVGQAWTNSQKSGQSSTFLSPAQPGSRGCFGTWFSFLQPFPHTFANMGFPTNPRKQFFFFSNEDGIQTCPVKEDAGPHWSYLCMAMDPHTPQEHQTAPQNYLGHHKVKCSHNTQNSSGQESPFRCMHCSPLKISNIEQEDLTSHSHTRVFLYMLVRWNLNLRDVRNR